MTLITWTKSPSLQSLSTWFRVQFSALSQIAREKPCDYLLLIYRQTVESLFLFYLSPLVTAACYRLQIGQPRPRLVKILFWQVNVDENWSLLSFCVFNFSCFSTSATERNATAIKILLFVVFCLFGFWLRKGSQSLATRVSSMAVFVVHVGFYSRVREKTKAVVTSLACRSCISGELEFLLWRTAK